MIEYTYLIQEALKSEIKQNDHLYQIIKWEIHKNHITYNHTHTTHKHISKFPFPLDKVQSENPKNSNVNQGPIYRILNQNQTKHILCFRKLFPTFQNHHITFASHHNHHNNNNIYTFSKLYITINFKS